MSENVRRFRHQPRKRDLVAGAVVLLALGGVLMSRGGTPAPTLAETRSERPVQSSTAARDKHATLDLDVGELVESMKSTAAVDAGSRKR